MAKKQRPVIHNCIRKLRFLNGEMTQQALADEVGVTRQTVIALEKGKYNPSLELAFRLAHAFGCPLEDVFQFDDGASSGKSQAGS
ncbi:MAG: helix-turn-helix transcriptional regulator [Pirellulaceae bacterium]